MDTLFTLLAMEVFQGVMLFFAALLFVMAAMGSTEKTGTLTAVGMLFVVIYLFCRFVSGLPI